MKNLFGVVPGAVYGWPKNILHFHGIDNSIVDLTATVRPQLSIVDGIVGMARGALARIAGKCGEKSRKAR